MKKKLIAFFMVFILSFSAITIHKQKEAHALFGGTLILGYTVGQVLGALLASATLVGAGYVVGDLADDGQSDFVDWLTNEYATYIRDHQQLPGQPPPPPHEITPLESAALHSLLTQQGIEVGSDLYEIARDYHEATSNPDNRPQPEEILEVISSTYSETYNIYNINWSSYYYGNASTNYIYLPKPEYKNTYIKIIFNNGVLHNNYIYLHIDDFGYHKKTTHGLGYPYMKFITPDNNILNGLADTNVGLRYADNFISIFSGTSYNTLTGSSSYSPIEEPIIDTNIPDIVIPPEFIPDPETAPPVFKRFDLSALNGLVASPEEMEGIINGTIEVTPERKKIIEDAWNEVLRDNLNNPNFQGLPDEPAEPETDPTTGNMYFGEVPDGPITDPENVPDDLTGLERIIYWLKGIWYAILDIPIGIINGLNKLYNLLSNWFNQFWTKIQEIIDDFWMSFSDWWQDNFIYHWTTFQNWIQNIWQGIPELLNNIWEWLQGLPVLDISNLLNNIWEWLQGLPDLIYSWFIPEPELIQDTWQPVIDLWNDKLDPVLAPFENLAFYEEELQDVSVNLKFGSYQGTHKIIDYQYVKSVKDSVKSIIRAFFWILIIFFNLDQVHRLIRNQSIINAYVRKIDPPKGRD